VNLEKFEEGDKVLFNDRKTPLEVVETSEEEIFVEGPSGGEYEIYLDGETLLVSKRGNRRYSSYCKDLRKVGEWERDGDTWRHSKSDAVVSLEENENGYWFVRSEDFEVDNPMYGFSSKEFAEEEAEKIVGENPEG
jgi:hypothetical protein